MTVCLAMHFGGYALLCADTRTVLKHAFASFHDDTAIKIQTTDIGLITGAGEVGLLEAVKNRFQSSEIKNHTDVRRIAEEERESIRRRATLVGNPTDIEEWIKFTGWFFTYQTLVDNSPCIRVGLIHPQVDLSLSNEKALCCVKEGQSMVIAPAEASIEEAENLRNVLQEKMRPVEDFPNLEEHFAYHRSVCGSVIWAVAGMFESVSHSMNVGIHTKSGQIEVSDRIDVS